MNFSDQENVLFCTLKREKGFYKKCDFFYLSGPFFSSGKASLATCKFEQKFAYWASPLLEELTLTFSLGTGFTNFTRTNETCSTSGCSGGIVIMERTCLNSTNCTGLTNNTIAYGEKEFVERLCSITENQMMGGCIPGKY